MLLLVLTIGCSSNWSCADKLSLGMTKNEVIEKCGSPNNIVKTVDTVGNVDRWIYYYYDIWTGYNRNIGQCDVYFLNEKVVRYQE